MNVSPPFHCFFTGSIVPRYKICLESVHIRNGYDAQGTDLQFFACQSSFAVHVSFTRTSSTLITVCQRRLLIGKLETRFLCLPDLKVLLSENDDPLKQATPIRGSRNWKLDIESVVSTSIRKQVMQE